MVDLFDKGDGHEADWPVMAQTVFAAAFSLLDEAKGDDRAMKVLRRVEVSLYERLAGKPEADDLPPAVEVGGPGRAPDPLRPKPLPEPHLRR